VVALEQAAAGPFATHLLADMGADVVKVERPGSGDVIRGWDRAVRGLSSGFVWLNRAKRSVALDFKLPAGREALERLVARSDVFLTNLGPGVAERAGFGYAAMSVRYPQLIYCNVSGYGSTGPYSDVKAYDLLVQGESGVLATTGYPGQPAKVGIPICDIAAGTYAALAIALALFQRYRTGRGQFLDISMFEATLDWLAYFPHHFWHAGEEPKPEGMRHPFIVPYGPYRTRDGEFVITGVSTPSDWRVICRDVFDRPDLLADQRFIDAPARRANRDVLEHIVVELFETRDLVEWLELLQRFGLPHGQLRGMAGVLHHPQVMARGLIREVDSPVGPVPTLETGLRLSDSPPARGPIPDLGGDTVAVLREVGYSDEEIARLRSDQVI
jgi:crotonobetainyl-CoA:carnitine CoA-transferase CaiB-like acyl-CoA transferase